METKTLWSQAYPIHSGIWYGLVLLIIFDVVLPSNLTIVVGPDPKWPMLKSAIYYYLLFGLMGINPGKDAIRTILADKFGEVEVDKAFKLHAIASIGTFFLVILAGQIF